MAPRFWELRATVAAGVITYAIQVPPAEGDSVALASVNPPPGFAAALEAAAGEGAAAVWTGGRLVAQRAGEVMFTVLLGGSGKHTLRISDPQGSAPIVIADACAYLTPPAMPADPTYVVGLNAAGGEFSDVFASDGSYRAYGSAYVYPSRPEQSDPALRHAEMDYWWSKGVRVIRVPFKWERIQHELFGPLFGEGSTGSWSGAQDMRRIVELVDYWTGLGGIVLLDLHNYMSYRFGPGSTGKVAYDRSVPIEALADVWVKLAERFVDNPKVWLGLMNEPSGDRQSAVRVAQTMQAVTNAIRARTDSLAKILVAGSLYSSASRWVSNGQAAAFDSFYDPANNFAFEPHNYFDADSSGTTNVCTVGTRNRLYAITDWARSRGFRLFMGELAADDGCGELVAAYQYMSDNRDVWLGWTTWGGGRFWTSTYFFRLDPSNYLTGPDTPRMQMLLPFLAA